MTALKSVPNMGKNPGLKGDGVCSIASSLAAGNGSLAACVAPDPRGSLYSPNTLYSPKLVHLCGTGDPATCAAQLSGMPGQALSRESLVQPRPTAPRRPAPPRTEVNRC